MRGWPEGLRARPARLVVDQPEQVPQRERGASRRMLSEGLEVFSDSRSLSRRSFSSGGESERCGPGPVGSDVRATGTCGRWAGSRRGAWSKRFLPSVLSFVKSVSNLRKGREGISGRSQLRWCFLKWECVSGTKQMSRSMFCVSSFSWRWSGK